VKAALAGLGAFRRIAFRAWQTKITGRGAGCAEKGAGDASVLQRLRGTSHRPGGQDIVRDGTSETRLHNNFVAQLPLVAVSRSTKPGSTIGPFLLSRNHTPRPETRGRFHGHRPRRRTPGLGKKPRESLPTGRRGVETEAHVSCVCCAGRGIVRRPPPDGVGLFVSMPRPARPDRGGTAMALTAASRAHRRVRTCTHKSTANRAPPFGKGRCPRMSLKSGKIDPLAGTTNVRKCQQTT